MENVQLTKEQLEELRLQEQEKETLLISNTRTLAVVELLKELDGAQITEDEERLIEKIEEKYLNGLKSPLRNQRRDLPIQFRRLLVLLREVENVNDREKVIEMGKTFSENMISFVPDHSDHRKILREMFSESMAIVFWSFIFPGEPYNKNTEAISKEKHLELKNLWWELQIEKWEILYDHFHNSESNLIKIFADDFITRPNAKRTSEEIQTYLLAWINKSGHGKRTNAKKEALKKCSLLDGIDDGTLKNWEDEWREFVKSRAENSPPDKFQ